VGSWVGGGVESWGESSPPEGDSMGVGESGVLVPGGVIARSGLFGSTRVELSVARTVSVGGEADVVLVCGGVSLIAVCDACTRVDSRSRPAMVCAPVVLMDGRLDGPGGFDQSWRNCVVECWALVGGKSVYIQAVGQDGMHALAVLYPRRP
jgi:hypothetical protein